MFPAREISSIPFAGSRTVNMFVSLQIPLADLRPFERDATGQLTVPTWPIPNLNREFIRGFGPVSKRLSGGIEDWQGESVFCKASRAVRIIPWPGALGRCVFRRFLHNGPVVSRFELGYLKPPDSAIQETLNAFLSLPVSVPAGKSGPRIAELAACGSRLAAHYLAATTSRKGAAATHNGAAVPQKGWVADGEPMLLVETDSTSVWPPYTREVAERFGIRLRHGHIPYEGRMLGCWFIERPSVLKGETRELLRRMRILLSRLHSERECLKAVLRAVNQGKVLASQERREDDPLQAYLQESLTWLDKKENLGLPQSELRVWARDLDDSFTQGEHAQLLALLGPIRRQLLKRVSEYTKPAPAVPAAGVECMISYSHRDEDFRKELEKHLSVLRHIGLLSVWNDRMIAPGADWEKDIDTRLDSAKLILLLISADFLNSEYCYGIEMKRALERAAAKDAIVVPIILRKCLWHVTPLKVLQALPRDAVPVATFPRADDAYSAIAEEIMQLLEKQKQ